MSPRTISGFATLAVAALIAFTGCTSTEVAPAAPPTAGKAVTIEDAWVKAAPSGMSAAFGVLTNSSDREITLLTATTTAASAVELHETVKNDSGEMMMQPKNGGFTIAAGETLVLEPGGNHIMLMGLLKPIMAGNDIAFTLTFSDGSTYQFTAPAKDYTGANETYSGDDMNMDDK